MQPVDSSIWHYDVSQYNAVSNYRWLHIVVWTIRKLRLIKVVWCFSHVFIVSSHECVEHVFLSQVDGSNWETACGPTGVGRGGWMHLSTTQAAISRCLNGSPLCGVTVCSLLCVDLFDSHLQCRCWLVNSSALSNRCHYSPEPTVNQLCQCDTFRFLTEEATTHYRHFNVFIYATLNHHIGSNVNTFHATF
jgi:hypothetical protein